MRWGRFRIEPDESGVRTVVSYGDKVWATLTVDGAQPAGRFTDDPDEVEHAFTIGRARLAIRHTVAEQWGVRWAFRNPTAEAVDPAVRLHVEASSRAHCWVWAAGAEGLIVLSPAEAARPVLALRVQQGALRASGEHLAMRPVGALPPGGRFVTVLRSRQHTSLTEVAASLPDWLPELTLEAGEPFEVYAPDWAIVPAQGLQPATEEGWVSVQPRPGLLGVAVHSPRGVTELEVASGPALDELLTGRAHDLLEEDVLDGAQACVVAEALTRNLVADPWGARRALRAAVRRPLGLLGIVALVNLTLLEGGSPEIARVFDELARQPVTPGYGRVVMRAWLASLSSGVEAGDRAAELLARRGGTLANFELSLLSLRSAEGAAGMLAAVINAVGGDLPGEPWDLEVADLARHAGLLALCPEEWPQAAEAARAADKTRTMLRAWLHQRPDDEALAWLAVDASLH